MLYTTHSLICSALCDEIGAEHRGRSFHLNIRWLIRKNTGESGPRIGTNALSKDHNHNFGERYSDSKWITK